MAKNGTREKIIEAAYVRFYRFGYNGSSVQDIVDMVGVQKRDVLQLFQEQRAFGP